MPTFTLGRQIVKKLQEKGYIAYFAGGWVRDFLMHRTSDDIDIATNASPEEVKGLFQKTIPVGIHFGIIVVVLKGHHFEIATFRQDEDYKDGRRPTKIKKAHPKEDAKRRDFTINGMFFDPLKQEIIDYVEGQKDIERGIIRCIGNPHKRFLEDRLRMIRAIRYASRFHFSIENETLKAILQHAHTLFPSVAIERVWSELSKMAAYPHFDKALISLHRLNLLPVIFSPLKSLSIEDIKKRVQFLPYFPNDAPLISKILELFPHASSKEKEALARYLKLSNEDKKFVAFSHFTHKAFQNDHLELSNWAKLYADPFFSLCLKIKAIHLPLDKRQAFLQLHHQKMLTLKLFIQRIKNKTPLLTSKHLREAGIENGKKMGKLLKEGERIAINHLLEDPKKIIYHLKKLPIWKD